MKKFLPILLVLAAVLGVTALVAGDEKATARQADNRKSETEQSTTPAESEGSTSLLRVETKKVCMVNDAVFAKDQIPVEVAGKTYYGCCEMCKGRLAQDAAIRVAVDPVTGQEVDKATAVIAARPDGSVLYFESEDTLKRYEESAAGSH